MAETNGSTETTEERTAVPASYDTEWAHMVYNGAVEMLARHGFRVEARIGTPTVGTIGEVITMVTRPHVAIVDTRERR